MTRLCVADTCRPARGRHLDGCDVEACPGCLPRLAEPGLAVCGVCEGRVRVGLRDLPALDVDLLTPTRAGSPNDVPNGEEYPAAAMGDPGRFMREAIRAMLVTWAKILMEERHVTCPPDTVRGMAHLVAVQAGWLLGSEHADQLVHDVVWVHDTARRTAHPGRPDGVRVECPECGRRVKLDIQAEVTRCECGEWGTIEWWREHLAPETNGLMSASELTSWLLLHHRLAVEQATIRQWAARELITRMARRIAGARPMLYDPAEVVAVAQRLTGQRKRSRMSA